MKHQKFMHSNHLKLESSERFCKTPGKLNKTDVNKC